VETLMYAGTALKPVRSPCHAGRGGSPQHRVGLTLQIKCNLGVPL